jgi:hypothetical protein
VRAESPIRTHTSEKDSPCRPTRRFIPSPPRPSRLERDIAPRTIAFLHAVNAGAAGSCSPVIPVCSPARSPTGGSVLPVGRPSSAKEPDGTRDEPEAHSPRTTHLVGHPRIVRPAIRAGHRRQLCELRTPNRRRGPRHVDVGDSARRRTTVRPTDAALCDLQA